MAPGGDLLLCLSLFAVLSPPVSSCIPHSIAARVPVRVDRGVVVSQVPLGGCRREGLHLTSSDPDFAVRDDGTIVTDRATTVTSQRTFRVWVSEGGEKGGRPRGMDVHLRPSVPTQMGSKRPTQKAPWDQGPQQKGGNKRPTQNAPWDQGPQQMGGNKRSSQNAPWDQSPQQKGGKRSTQKAPWDQARKRSKRRWSPLPFNIIEHDTPPFPKDVELVGSDSAVNFSVYYTIRGPGVTLAPKDLFSVDRDTGMLRVHYAVDREQYQEFVFDAQVWDSRSNTETDQPLPITVLVMDINDNAPTFTGPLEFHVTEQSNVGTDVGVILAADIDLEGHLHSKIRFTLLTATQLFNIHPGLGHISTKTATLDREAQASIPVTVEIRDMDGATTGLFSTATATVNLVDINDNPPTFRETAYKATIEENKAGVLVLRIPVDDKDQENTKNWNAKFTITEGNADGAFRMETDPKTNEGLLYVVKPLDYEKGSTVMLRVTAENEVPLVGSAGSWVSVPVEVGVANVDEGPEFVVPNMVIKVKENTPNGTVLGTYAALDPETKSSAGMTYYKVLDPGSWVGLSQTSGELTVTNTIDLESPLVTNNMYIITIKAVDNSSMSGVGTVTLLIEDVNDNLPGLVLPDTGGDGGGPGALVVCEEDEEGKMGSVTVHATDADQSPYSAPFHFQLGDGHDGKWRIGHTTNTSAVLQQAVDMPRQTYVVPIQVSDLQGRGVVQEVTVRVCRCLGGECVAQQTSTALGVWGVLAMLLALLLLLLLCIFFVFACSTKGDKIYLEDTGGGMLLKSNTEAPGEEVKSTDLFLIPTAGGAADTVDGSVKGAGLLEQKAAMMGGGGSTLIGQQQQNMTMTQQSMYQSSRNDFMTTQQGMNSFYGSGGGGGGHYRGPGYMDSLYYRQSHLSALHTWDTNGLYLDRKLGYFADESEERYADDAARAYGYEGEGSAAGSVGCCSELGDQDDLAFLEDLDPSKFKTLAHICMDRGEEEEEGEEGEEP